MAEEPVFERDDVDAIFSVLFDMRLELFRIRRLRRMEEEWPRP